MLGAIAGDIIGSVYELNPVKTKKFNLFSPACTFTDDTVLTVAVADVLLHHGNYPETFRKYYKRFPYCGYGQGFRQWAENPDAAANPSFGNGSAMRVSPAGWAFESMDEVLEEARRSAIASHNHPEGIKGAQSVAAAIYLARTGSNKDQIRRYIVERFHYDLDRKLDEIRPAYSFNVTCQGSVPEAIIAFLESCDLEDAIRNAISLGGDSDTMACIAGAIAEAYYREINPVIIRGIESHLDKSLTSIIYEFTNKFCCYKIPT